MEIVPSDAQPERLPDAVADDGEGDVQRVRVVRRASEGPPPSPVDPVATVAEPPRASVGGSAYVKIDVSSPLGTKSAAIFGTGKRTFFPTVKRMLLLGAVLAFLAAWYVDRGAVLRDALVVLLVFVPSIGVAVALAARLTAANLAVETWRRTGLVMSVLDALLDRMAGPSGQAGTALATRPPTAEDSPADATSAPAPPPALGVLPLPEALARLERAAEAWTRSSGLSSAVGGTSTGLGGLVGRAQRWVAGLVEHAARREMRRAAVGGRVDLVAVRAALVDRLDDAVAARVRATNRSAVAGAVLALVAWAAVVAYAVSRIWS